MDDYNVKFEIWIDWSEIDLFGHFNNLAIMKYVQAARVHYLELTGLMQMQAELKKGPILASVSCQFRKTKRSYHAIKRSVRMQRCLMTF